MSRHSFIALRTSSTRCFVHTATTTTTDKDDDDDDSTSSKDTFGQFPDPFNMAENVGVDGSKPLTPEAARRALDTVIDTTFRRQIERLHHYGYDNDAANVAILMQLEGDEVRIMRGVYEALMFRASRARVVFVFDCISNGVVL
jgi:hypothetical protein